MATLCVDTSCVPLQLLLVPQWLLWYFDSLDMCILKGPCLMLLAYVSSFLPWDFPDMAAWASCKSFWQHHTRSMGHEMWWINYFSFCPPGSLVAQMVKNPPAMRDIWVQSLSWEDPLEKGMATHSSILAWEFYGQRSQVGYSPWGHRVWHDLATNIFFFISKSYEIYFTLQRMFSWLNTSVP